MKKIFTFLIFLLAATGFSQQKIAQRVAELKEAKSAFKRVSVLDVTSDPASPEVAKAVEKSTLAKIRTADVNALVSTQPETIELDIPYMGGQITVELYKEKILNDQFHIDTDKQSYIDFQPGAYYRGIVKGDAHSVVAMNFFDNELNGVISAGNIGNVVVGKLDKAGNTQDYIIYSDADLTMSNPFNCGMKIDAEDPNYVPGNETARSAMSLKCVTVFFEIDYDLYLQNGSSTATTANWMTSVFNNVSTLYANDGITVALKSTFIWTVDDPYEGDGSSDYLYQFNSIRPVFDGDIGMLVGIDPGGLGGVAVTINGLCTTNNFSYSDVNFSYSTVPTYSWNIEVITHEMGHLMGSPHTHACAWNGNNTAIDNCGSTALGQEGTSCITSPPTIPSAAVKGTIMSYCHLVSGVGISFNNGFGPQPAQRILNAVNAGTCLSTDCTNTCINTTANLQATNVTTNSATLTWTELGSATQWQILVTPFATNFGIYTTVNSPTYQANNLQPNSFYKVRIKPVCASGLASPIRQYIFATSANWCNGITITDTGGTAGDYTDNQDYVRVMIPTLPNKKIELTFTQFDLEEGYDYIYLYDGASTSAPDISSGGLTGEDMIGPFPPYTSTSPDGALTLRFFSDPGVVASGYTATVACQDLLGLNDAHNIDFTYYPNPAKDAINIVSKTPITNIEVYNITGQLLYVKKGSELETKVDMSAYATGTYFFKLKFGEYSANFKVMKQ